MLPVVAPRKPLPATLISRSADSNTRPAAALASTKPSICIVGATRCTSASALMIARSCTTGTVLAAETSRFERASM